MGRFCGCEVLVNFQQLKDGSFKLLIEAPAIVA